MNFSARKRRLPKHPKTCAKNDVYLPSDPPRGRTSLLCVRTGLRVRRTIAADGGPRTTNSDQHRMHRAWLYLAVADDGLRPAGLTAAAAALRALVHVQLTRLHGTAATSCGTAAPGTLDASPHPLHSTTGVRLPIGRPTPPLAHTRARARATPPPLRSSPRDLGRARFSRCSPRDETPTIRRDARFTPLPPSSCHGYDNAPFSDGCADKSGRLAPARKSQLTRERVEKT